MPRRLENWRTKSGKLRIVTGKTFSMCKRCYGAKERVLPYIKEFYKLDENDPKACKRIGRRSKSR
jgi:hypothetical protein